MKTSLSIDKAGRIVLPQTVRRQFHLVAGDHLDLTVMPDGVLLRTRVRQDRITEKNGLLVHEGEPMGDLVHAIEQSRSNRDAEVLGLRQ